ncbi:MAG: biopolymer transporter ExbD, partial [Planctomycetia bacterium]|nr:biopolymer transporter ExbD [Planctomycetia bacterium]
ESSIKLDLPSASTGEKTKPKETGKIIINVVAKDILFFGDSPISLQDLSRRLREERMKTEIPLEVRIRTNRQVPYSVIEPVLVLCAQAGIGNVSFSVLEGSDP